MEHSPVAESASTLVSAEADLYHAVGVCEAMESLVSALRRVCAAGFDRRGPFTATDGTEFSPGSINA